MFTIVGLGNPGEEYRDTRHNAGVIVLETFLNAYSFPEMVSSSAYASLLSEGSVKGQDVRVIFPQTFMNKSGSAVRKAVEKGDEKRCIVVYDDAALPLGDVRISVGRGSGGHNGIESIIAALGTKEFVRVRIGIAPKNIFGMTVRPTGEKMTKHVLGKFKKQELAVLEKTAEKVAEAIGVIITDGVEKAMNTFN